MSPFHSFLVLFYTFFKTSLCHTQTYRFFFTSSIRVIRSISYIELKILYLTIRYRLWAQHLFPGLIKSWPLSARRKYYFNIGFVL